jgi:beta-lactamase regulating signal transducer with metallopeptidase domain
METAIIISVALILLGSTFLFIPKLRNKMKKRTNTWVSFRVTWISFLVSLAGLIVTIFSIVPKVTNINHFNVELKEQVEKQIRQIEEKIISKTDTIIQTQIDTVIVFRMDTVVIRDTISVRIPKTPENDINDEVKKVDDDARSFWERVNSELEKNN